MVVHFTCLANTMFCGIHLGVTVTAEADHEASALVLIPLITVRRWART